MIPFCWDEISTRSARTDLPLQLHGEINFHPGQEGQVFTWYSFTKTLRLLLIYKCSKHDEML